MKYCSTRCQSAGQNDAARLHDPDGRRWYFHLGAARHKACQLCPQAVACQLNQEGKRACTIRNDHWNPTREEHIAFTSQPCAYCGMAFPFVTVDRVDSTRGYRSDNIAPCCVMCNHAKNDHPLDEFLSWARRIAEHQKIFT